MNVCKHQTSLPTLTSFPTSLVSLPPAILSNTTRPPIDWYLDDQQPDKHEI